MTTIDIEKEREDIVKELCRNILGLASIENDDILGIAKDLAERMRSFSLVKNTRKICYDLWEYVTYTYDTKVDHLKFDNDNPKYWEDMLKRMKKELGVRAQPKLDKASVGEKISYYTTKISVEVLRLVDLGKKRDLSSGDRIAYTIMPLARENSKLSLIDLYLYTSDLVSQWIFEDDPIDYNDVLNDEWNLRNRKIIEKELAEALADAQKYEG